MKQLLINVFCPSTSKSYDFWIPSNMKAETAVRLISEDIRTFEDNSELLENVDELILCSYLHRKTLVPSFSMEQNGIMNGDRLALL